MASSVRSLFSWMFAAAATLALTACGGGGGGSSSSSPSPTPSVTVAVSPTTATVTASTTKQFSATVANATTTTVTWSVQEGVSGGTVNATGLYTAPSTPGTYHVIATSTASPMISATATVTVVAPPAITGFKASPTAVTSGGSSTLTATFTGGTGSLDHGLGTVTSGTGVSTGAVTTTTTYTLTVTNAAGSSVTAQATVSIFTSAPTITSFKALPATLTLGDSTTLVWTLGSPATSVSIDQNVGAVTGSSSIAASPTTTTTYTLTATNPLGSATATVTVTVVFAPSITSFTASPTTVTPNGSSTLTAIFTHGSGVITPGNVSVTTGTGISVGPLAADTTYTLTVTNSAGTSVTSQRTVYVDPGTYTPAGNTMSVAREWHTCTLMPNGKALVAGGTAVTAAADEFDPAANGGLGGFSTTANGMSTIREAASAVLLPNGKTLVVGGYNPNAALPRQLTSADLYDPATRTFTPSASQMGTARQQCTATLLLNGKVLIVGGFNDTVHTLGSAEFYDPTTDTFSPSAASLGAPRFGHLATLLPDGKVLIVGGSGTGATPPAAEVYDPQMDAFMPAGGSNLAAQWFTQTRLTDGKVLIALTGMNLPSISLVFDPATGQATATAGSPNSGRIQMPTATLLGDGRVLFAGNIGLPGYDTAGDSELYTPGTQLYHYTGNPGDRWGQVATLLPDGRALLVGGWGSSLKAPLSTATLFSANPTIPAPVPSATVTTVAATAKTSTTGLTASVASTSGATYYWIIQNGTITGGLGTPTITFTAGAAGTLQVDCLVVSPCGIPSHGSAQVSVTP